MKALRIFLIGICILSAVVSNFSQQTCEATAEGITKEQAIEIAKADAIIAYKDLEPFEIVVSESKKKWYVDFQLKNKGLKGGGPLILINSDSALKWRGVWGNSGSPESLSDYERAGSIEGYLGTLDVQKDQALILWGEPMRTSVKRLGQNDVMIVRWVWAPDETQAIESLPLALESTDWVETDLIMEHPSETFVIFDSAAEFSEVDDFLEISFSAGSSRISTLEFKPNDSVFLILHRIKGIT